MVDEKKRRFLKHLGIVTGAGVVGLAIAQGSTTQAETLIDDLESAEQARGFRRVWARIEDRNANYGRTYEEYYEDAKRLGVWSCPTCRYVYGVAEGRVTRFDELPPTWVCTECGGTTKGEFENIGIAFRSGGQPRIKEQACAYHFDVDGDGNYEESERGVYCTMPCETICPVIPDKAIRKEPMSFVKGRDAKPKIGPKVDYDLCIGCGRCHKICGYNVVEWVNVPFDGKGDADLGGDI